MPPSGGKSTKTCEKRHPKKCKRYNTEKGCRFGSECGYHHSKQHDDSKTCECKAKIDILEKIATEITNKIIDHENKLDNMKTLYTEHGELKEKVNLCEAVVQKMFMNKMKLEAEVKDLNTIIKSKVSNEEAAHNLKQNDEKEDCKSSQEKTIKPSHVEGKENKDKQTKYIKCEVFEYSCKNINGMRKHMNMKHGDHKFKICDIAFTNSMDVLAHTAKCHDQEEKKVMKQL